MSSVEGDAIGYFALINSGPLIVLRVPLKGKPGRRRNAITATQWRRSQAGIRKRFGLKLRDVFGLDPIAHPDDLNTVSQAQRKDAEDGFALCTAAYSGEPKMAEFWLFAWDAATEAFEVVRAPVRKGDV